MAVCNVSFVALPDQTSVFFFFFERENLTKEIITFNKQNAREEKWRKREKYINSNRLYSS